MSGSIISSVEVQKHNSERVNVYIDGEYSFSCNAEIVYKYNIKKGTLIDVEELSRVIEEDNFLKAKNSAFRIIEKSYKTEKDIRERLSKKGYDDHTIKKVIDFFNEYDFIDDKKYAQAYIKEKIKLQGRNKIKYSLLNKGIKEDIINEIFYNIIDESKEIDSAKVLALKKYNILCKRETDLYKIKNKLYQYLLGRGFNYDIAKKAVEELMLDFSH